MVFDKKPISFLNRNTVFYECGAGISNARKRDPRILQEMGRDGWISSSMMIARCEAYPFDEFAKRLKLKHENDLKQRIYNMELEKKPKIIRMPIKFFKFISTSFMRLRRRLSSFTTDTKVSTDFANLCLNRK